MDIKGIYNFFFFYSDFFLFLLRIFEHNYAQYIIISYVIIF